VTSSHATPPGPQVEKLVQENLPLVGYVVRETMARVPGHVQRDDLASAGMYALVLAAQAYDAERGVPFNRYATTRIRGAIVDELRGLDWASRSVRRRSRQIEELRGDLAVRLGRPASGAELAQALGLSADELAAHQKDVSRASVTSLNAVQDAGADQFLPSGGPTPQEVLEQREKVAYLQDAVVHLPERLRAVVQGYFFEERPMAELAAELGVSESRISQMRAEALVLLRDALNSAIDPNLVAEYANPTGVAARRREAYFAEVAAHRSFISRLAPTASESQIA
jgi:RNA polymerase sigma factor for flagellar operon FliA